MGKALHMSLAQEFKRPAVRAWQQLAVQIAQCSVDPGCLDAVAEGDAGEGAPAALGEQVGAAVGLAFLHQH